LDAHGRIRNEFKPPIPLPTSRAKIVDEIVQQIKDASDRLNTPIFREQRKFFIYCRNEPIEISRSAFEWYLIWVAGDFGVDQAIAKDISFRNMLFGACWRSLAPET
jgi:hypothetical protein